MAGSRRPEGLLERLTQESASELCDLIGVGVEPAALRDFRTTTTAPVPAAQQAPDHRGRIEVDIVGARDDNRDRPRVRRQDGDVTWPPHHLDGDRLERPGVVPGEG